MNWLVCHIASGHAFFSGVALIIVAAVASNRPTAFTKRLTVYTFLFGAIAIGVSSAAIPYWYYAIASVVTIAWLISAYRPSNARRWTQRSVIVAWAVAAAIELPYHITPSLAPAASRSMAIIGDSVTAGMGASDTSVRWPTLLAKQHGVIIQDISHMGETTASALTRAEKHHITAPVLLLEIGGNDLLGFTSSAQFARDLDALLAHVSAPGRQVVLFELPLPPFYHEYGRIQRVLARKHNVSLVPKRTFMSVLTGTDATLDTIHLSQAGHELMAATVWNVVRSAFPDLAEPDEPRERPIATD